MKLFIALWPVSNMLHFGQQTCIKKELGVFNLHCTICLNFLSVVKGLQIFEFIISDYVLYSVMGCHTIETSLYVQTSPVYLQETADLVENYIFSTPPPPQNQLAASPKEIIWLMPNVWTTLILIRPWIKLISWLDWRHKGLSLTLRKNKDGHQDLSNLNKHHTGK